MNYNGTSKRALLWADITDSDEETTTTKEEPKSMNSLHELNSPTEIEKPEGQSGNLKRSQLRDFRQPILNRIFSSGSSDIYLHLSNLPPNFNSDDIASVYPGYSIREVVTNQAKKRCDILLSKEDAVKLVNDREKRYLKGSRVHIDFSYKNDTETKETTKEIKPKKEVNEAKRAQKEEKEKHSARQRKSTVQKKREDVFYFLPKEKIEQVKKVEEKFKKRFADEEVVKVEPFVPMPVPSLCEDSSHIVCNLFLHLEEEKRNEQLKRQKVVEKYNRSKRSHREGFYAWGRKDTDEFEESQGKPAQAQVQAKEKEMTPAKAEEKPQKETKAEVEPKNTTPPPSKKEEKAPTSARKSSSKKAPATISRVNVFSLLQENSSDSEN